MGARQKSEQEKLKKTMDTIFSDINMISNTVATKNILAVLFPKTKDVFCDIVGISNYYDGRNYSIRNKISVSTCFERYFALTLETDAIPTDMIRRMIYDAEADEVLSGMDSLYQNGKIKRLFDEINNYMNSDRIAEVSSKRASLLLKCLAIKYGEFVVEDNGFTEIPFERRFQICLNSLLKRIDVSFRFMFLQECFEDEQIQVSTLAIILHELERQQGRFIKSEDTEREKLLELQNVLEIEKIFEKRAKEALNSREIFFQHNGLNFLWLLDKLDTKYVTQKKKEIVKDEISLIKVISYCIGYGTTTSGFVSSKMWNLDSDRLQEFIDVNDAYQCIYSYVSKGNYYRIPKENRKDVIAFIIAIEQDLGENQHVYESMIKEKMKKWDWRNKHILEMVVGMLMMLTFFYLGHKLKVQSYYHLSY